MTPEEFADISSMFSGKNRASASRSSSDYSQSNVRSTSLNIPNGSMFGASPRPDANSFKSSELCSIGSSNTYWDFVSSPSSSAESNSSTASNSPTSSVFTSPSSFGISASSSSLPLDSTVAPISFHLSGLELSRSVLNSTWETLFPKKFPFSTEDEVSQYLLVLRQEIEKYHGQENQVCRCFLFLLHVKVGQVELALAEHKSTTATPVDIGLGMLTRFGECKAWEAMDVPAEQLGRDFLQAYTNVCKLQQELDGYKKIAREREVKANAAEYAHEKCSREKSKLTKKVETLEKETQTLQGEKSVLEKKAELEKHSLVNVHQDTLSQRAAEIETLKDHGIECKGLLDSSKKEAQFYRKLRRDRGIELVQLLIHNKDLNCKLNEANRQVQVWKANWESINNGLKQGHQDEVSQTTNGHPAGDAESDVSDNQNWGMHYAELYESYKTVLGMLEEAKKDWEEQHSIISDLIPCIPLPLGDDPELADDKEVKLMITTFASLTLNDVFESIGNDDSDDSDDDHHDGDDNSSSDDADDESDEDNDESDEEDDDEKDGDESECRDGDGSTNDDTDPFDDEYDHRWTKAIDGGGEGAALALRIQKSNSNNAKNTFEIEELKSKLSEEVLADIEDVIAANIDEHHKDVEDLKAKVIIRDLKIQELEKELATEIPCRDKVNRTTLG
jgi:hypothetical protein